MATTFKIDRSKPYSTLEAAIVLGLPQETVKRACESGEIFATPSGSDYLIVGYCLQRFIEKATGIAS